MSLSLDYKMKGLTAAHCICSYFMLQADWNGILASEAVAGGCTASMASRLDQDDCVPQIIY
jgi:hypothetical protein